MKVNPLYRYIGTSLYIVYVHVSEQGSPKLILVHVKVEWYANKNNNKIYGEKSIPIIL